MFKFNDLVGLIYSIRDKGLLEDFLTALTTAHEREELPRRVEIVSKLLAGEAQHKVAKDLGVGISTVTRGSKELRQGRFKVLRKGTTNNGKHTT